MQAFPYGRGTCGRPRSSCMRRRSTQRITAGRSRPSPLPVRPKLERHASRRGIETIRHVIVIMQENRSFDSYFGTFPGADGIPRAGGDFAVCLPDPRSGGCQKPYHDSAQVNGGGQHDADVASEDVDGGRMDGFVRMAEAPGGRGCGGRAFRLLVVGSARRDGLPRRTRDTELLALGARLHAAGPDVRVERFMEPSRAPLPRVRMVGPLHAQADPASCVKTTS